MSSSDGNAGYFYLFRFDFSLIFLLQITWLKYIFVFFILSIVVFVLPAVTWFLPLPRLSALDKLSDARPRSEPFK